LGFFFYSTELPGAHIRKIILDIVKREENHYAPKAAFNIYSLLL